MESLRRAERLRGLQAANRRRLVERGISADDLAVLIRDAYKNPACRPCAHAGSAVRVDAMRRRP